MPKLKLLVMTDLHYIGLAKQICDIKERNCAGIPKLIERVFEAVEDKEIDLIVILGDLVDNGNAQGALEDLLVLKTQIKKFNKPIFAAPGNHDSNAEQILDIFECRENIIEVNGYQLVRFTDKYLSNDICIRNYDEMKKTFAKLNKNEPIIALQHNPILPKIESTYPYNIIDYEKIIDFYSHQNVLLSLSGHFHLGIQPIIENGVEYITVAALCEFPYNYSIITFEDKQIDVAKCRLDTETVSF